MKESAWQRLWIGLGLLAICVQISYSETVALPQDALVIVAVVDYSGQRPVVAWPDTWTGLDGQPLGDAKDSRFI